MPASWLWMRILAAPLSPPPPPPPLLLLQLLLLLLLPLLQKDTKKQLRKGPGAPPWDHFLVKVLFETLLFSSMC